MCSFKIQVNTIIIIIIDALVVIVVIVVIIVVVLNVVAIIAVVVITLEVLHCGTVGMKQSGNAEHLQGLSNGFPTLTLFKAISTSRKKLDKTFFYSIQQKLQLKCFLKTIFGIVLAFSDAEICPFFLLHMALYIEP